MDETRVKSRFKLRLPWQRPTDPTKAVIGSAHGHFAAGDFVAGERVLLSGLNQFPDSLSLKTELAELAITQKNWQLARDRWEHILECHDERPPVTALVRAVYALRNCGAAFEAAATARHGLTLYPGSAPLLRELARSATAREDWSEALSAWTNVLQSELGRMSSEAFASVSRSLRNLGKVKEAGAIIQTALLEFPRDVCLLAERAVLENYNKGSFGGSLGRSDRRFQSVEIVVCVFDALDKTKKCLEALTLTTGQEQLITVVDDASKPEVRDFLLSFVSRGSNRRLLINKTNQGYTKSANRALHAARADWALLLNSDTLVTDGWLDGLLQCANSDPALGAVGPLSNAATVQSLPWAEPAMEEDGSPRLEDVECVAEQVRSLSVKAYPKVPMLNGFCLMLKMSALGEVGYLDEVRFPRGYGEENDLCLRLLERGYKLAIADDVYVYHSRSASFGSNVREELTAKAVETLRELWPGYSYRYVSDVIHELPALRQLRSGLKGLEGVEQTSCN